VVSRRTKNVVFQRNALYFADLEACHIPRGMRPRLLLQRALALAAMRRADLILVPSRAMKDLIVERAPWAARRDIDVMPHGFDPGSREDLGSAAGEEAFPKDGTLTLFYPAGPAPHKDFETLIRAVRRLADSGCKARLLLTARHEAWPEVVIIYERLIRELALEESVRMLGLVSHDEMDGLYRRADIVVFPSLCESFGYPLLEAMNWRKPIVASAIPINREMCAEGATYFEASNSESLAHAVLSLCNRTERERLRLGQEVRLTSRDWGWPAYCKEFRSTLEKVAG
jgi:glycosyltransferase involved in cell wall biosynthesis